MAAKKHTPRQQPALEHFCRFAFETMNPRLAWLVPEGRICLTIAAGHE